MFLCYKIIVEGYEFYVAHGFHVTFGKTISRIFYVIFMKLVIQFVFPVYMCIFVFTVFTVYIIMLTKVSIA